MSTAGLAVEAQQQPATIADAQIGLNGAIAAALTRLVGSMPALYVVLTFVGGWMALATWGPLHQVDPFPFPFLLFLNNVVQLVLCLVILVGQRVLGMAADRRAVQTYLNAEAIFEQVADLQAHLDRHDLALSRGVSLLETSPHPWIERHRVQRPPQALDQAVSLNGRIAAWLTGRLGSMWAFYLAAASQVVWIGLAELHAQRVDPYPFPFMTFLSTLAQLVFMVVIMVGQDVLGRAADRRSEQTFLDAEAILHECRRMKARLTAQDRVIESLSGYTVGQVTERLAQAIHAADAAARPALPPWEELPEQLRESNRARARQIGEELAAIGCLMVPAFDATVVFAFTDDEAHLLARLEHARWSDRDRDLAAWEELPDEARVGAVTSVQRLPAMLARVGFQVVRDGSAAQEGARQTDFTAEEWAILQQSLMASGVLVALAEGVADAEEIFALIKKLRDASVVHPRRFIRELTAGSTFNTGLRPETRYEDYERPALAALRSAVAILVRVAPSELADFRAFLVEIAEVVADANREGGFLGVGAHARVANEAAAIEAVRRATAVA